MRSSSLNDLAVTYSYIEKRKTCANGGGFYFNATAILHWQEISKINSRRNSMVIDNTLQTTTNGGVPIRRIV